MNLEEIVRNNIKTQNWRMNYLKINKSEYKKLFIFYRKSHWFSPLNTV